MSASEPVVRIPGDEGRQPEAGTALCLSGGGYRAMVFHVGALWRMHETGFLTRLDRISSVSGGSITAGVLALKWDAISKSGGDRGTFIDAVVAPIRAFASYTLDVRAIAKGLFLPGTVGQRVASAYDGRLFRGATLQDLPDKPRFVINATNLQSGALWRFMKPYMRDWRVGEVKNPRQRLADAVAASSAFPPFLSPVSLSLDGGLYTPGSGVDLQRVPYTTRVVLTDGGVYDNLGLETAYKRYTTILVSDAGGKMPAVERPKSTWGRHTKRVLDVIDNQVRSLRKRQLIEAYRAGNKQGAYWGIRTNVDDYGLEDALPCPFAATQALADEPTRLKAMDARLQERLINWGYAVCDTALRRHVDASIARPAAFPYPDAGI